VRLGSVGKAGSRADDWIDVVSVVEGEDVDVLAMFDMEEEELVRMDEEERTEVVDKESTVSAEEESALDVDEKSDVIAKEDSATAVKGWSGVFDEGASAEVVAEEPVVTFMAMMTTICVKSEMGWDQHFLILTIDIQ